MAKCFRFFENFLNFFKKIKKRRSNGFSRPMFCVFLHIYSIDIMLCQLLLSEITHLNALAHFLEAIGKLADDFKLYIKA